MGSRAGNWLSVRQAQRLLKASDVSRVRSLDVAFHPTDYLAADTSVGSSVCLFHSSQEPS
jgi:hypothetical protein